MCNMRVSAARTSRTSSTMNTVFSTPFTDPS
jgi:hypothetical protein